MRASATESKVKQDAYLEIFVLKVNVKK